MLGLRLAQRLPCISPRPKPSTAEECTLCSLRSYLCEGVPEGGEKRLHASSPQLALLFSIKQVVPDRI